MGKRYPTLSDRHIEFIDKQPLFFVATAGEDTRANVSPKGMDSLKVCSPDHLIWLNLTGSGNETAAHLESNPRMTLMWCAFVGKPLILRVYGKAEVYYPTDAEWQTLTAHFQPLFPGARQCFSMRIELVQTSCGMAVPLMEYQSDRTLLNQWAETQGDAGISAYWSERNTTSLDGAPINSMRRFLSKN